MPDSAAAGAAASTTHPPDPPGHPEPPIAPALLDRPSAQRVQEFRYRFGQAVVFGLPVLGLQWFGRSLGGAESERWVALLQALLAGWVVYVATTGMVIEAGLIFSTRRRIPPAIGLDALVACVCAGVYLFSLALPLGLLIRPHFSWPAGFHWCVLMLVVWSAVRWASLSNVGNRK